MFWTLNAGVRCAVCGVRVACGWRVCEKHYNVCKSVCARICHAASVAARRREQQASRRPTFSPGVSQHVYPEDDEFFPPNGDQGSGFDFDKGSDADRAGKHDISEQKEEKEPEKGYSIAFRVVNDKNEARHDPAYINWHANFLTSDG